jgi:hypothetical protein
MKKVTWLQREWIKWLLTIPNSRLWLDSHIPTAKGNIDALHKVFLTWEYDIARQALLNWLLGKFNEDERLMISWKEYLKGENYQKT